MTSETIIAGYRAAVRDRTKAVREEEVVWKEPTEWVEYEIEEVAP
jgi:hypothetical protein